MGKRKAKKPTEKITTKFDNFKRILLEFVNNLN